MPSDTPRRLGRGLGALLAPPAVAEPRNAGPTPDGGVQRVPLGQIRPNPFQPRKEFAPEELAELASSLKASGLLQPIQNFSFTIPKLPFGLTIQKVLVTPSGLVGQISATHVPFSQ